MSNPELDRPSAAWLVSGAGRELVEQATRALRGGQDALHVQSALRRGGAAPAHTRAAMLAAEARLRAAADWVDASDLLFLPRALEQASHPAVSLHRSGRFSGLGVVIDACSGVGGDALQLAAEVDTVVAVDLDPARLQLLRHNAAVRGVSVLPVEADARRPPVRPGGWLHADPSRRAANDRRVRRLQDYGPPPGELLRVFAPRGSGIVLSPAVDLHDPGLPDGEIEFVSVDGRLVEAVVWTGELSRPGAAASATLLPRAVSRVRRGEVTELHVAPPGEWLIEVAPAAVRARLHDEIGAEIGGARLARSRALLSTRRPPPPSPWYSAREVLAVLPAHAAPVRDWYGTEGAGAPIEIVLHGLDADPQRWWADLGRPPRGPQGLRIELVRLDDGAAALVTRAAPS